MKTLLLIKGLSKLQIKNWIAEENLEKYYLDFLQFQSLYSQTEWNHSGKVSVKLSYSDLVMKRFIEILNLKMTKGNMVILDTDMIGEKNLKALCTVYGYTLFSKMLDIPSDYIINYKYYSEGEDYDEKRVGERIKQFLSQNVLGIKINRFQDILDYFIKKKETVIKINNKRDSILFVSDLHSNYSLYKQLPQASYTVFLGDYIDGDEVGGSRKLIDLIGKQESCVWIEGNHEINLRKYLGSIIYPNLLKDFYDKTVYSKFKETTEAEFKDLDIDEAVSILKKLNQTLVEYAFVEFLDKTAAICTHCGLKSIEQLDPRYISSVIYNSHGYSDSNDLYFSKNNDGNLLSIHAHCKYSCNMEDTEIINQKFKKVINLDPISKNTISYCIINNTSQSICHLEK